MAIFIGSEIYRGSRYGRLHPLSIERVPAVIDLCRALGWLSQDEWRVSPRAKPAALTGFHAPRYIAALRAAEAAGSVSEEVRLRHGLGTLSNPVFPEMYRRPATAVGGGLLAAEMVAASPGVVFNPGGGTHHALADRASGFCFLNEPVLTIRHLLRLGMRRVAYVDIDAHHGDGVEIAFDGSEQVRVISVHEAKRWPFTGEVTDRAGGAAFNLPVPRDFNDTEFSHVLEQMILPAVAAFRPDAIFLQCGADAVLEDPLARLSLSNNSHARAAAALRALAPAMIVSGGGGYNPWSAPRCWSLVWATLSGREVPERLPEPARAVLARQSWARRGQPSEPLLTTLRDAPREGGVRDEVRQGVRLLRQRLRAEH
ncbi:acetoin utilization protein AcuC [Alloyangia pacifica]|uniref:Acetoin utilization protein AcuC n=1 Tax=Alloyangia pacifica TaxID=311180 RepID=A0A1I6PUB7_9RHOB|nr:acetoin utilization protein AcuC [Alloyangia pacifica]SDG35818.1 acetoin utilization protein AcuC [Alloyangia pacifica]SFS43794.1 acetoin utilization protein AcuC [Alloyangia pacifica]